MFSSLFRFTTDFRHLAISSLIATGAFAEEPERKCKFNCYYEGKAVQEITLIRTGDLLIDIKRPLVIEAYSSTDVYNTQPDGSFLDSSRVDSGFSQRIEVTVVGDDVVVTYSFAGSLDPINEFGIGCGHLFTTE